MGVKVFRADNWHRIKLGVIFRRDVMGLDPDKDSKLIGYLIAHAMEPCRYSMVKYVSENYGMDEITEPEKIREFCQIMLLEKGPFKAAAEEILSGKPGDPLNIFDG